MHIVFQIWNFKFKNIQSCKEHREVALLIAKKKKSVIYWVQTVWFMVLNILYV